MFNRENGIELSKEQYFIEFNIGHQLSSLWNLPVNNDTTHAFHPNDIYKYKFDFLKQLKDLGINKQDLLEAKVKKYISISFGENKLI